MQNITFTKYTNQSTNQLIFLQNQAKFANDTKYTRFQKFANNLYNMQCLAFKQIQICFDFGHGNEDLKYYNYYATLKKYAKFANMQNLQNMQNMQKMQNTIKMQNIYCVFLNWTRV